MSRYRHVFFDLDHTLWDFRSNSRCTLIELHEEMELTARGVGDPDAFVEVYEEVNAGLWRSYENGALDKAVLRVLRFDETLKRFGVKDGELAGRLGREYLSRCPKRSALNPGVGDLLNALRGNVAMHVITNGFQEVQELKLISSGITPYFNIMLTSERAGARKPSPVIFAEALRLAGADREGSLMVGDDIRADMEGARGAGIDQAHFVADGMPADADATYRFSHFNELLPLFL